MKKADASGAALALIVGEDEIKAGAVSVKPLRDARAQQSVSRGDIAARLHEFLKGS
jgi:histidyl-tRNA synthetase